MADSLRAPDGSDLNVAALYQDVLLKRVTAASAAAQLPVPELRQLAYELAVGVCDADGLRNEQETRFLADLGAVLGLTQPQMAEPAATADALATVPLEEVVPARATSRSGRAVGTARERRPRPLRACCGDAVAAPSRRISTSGSWTVFDPRRPRWSCCSVDGLDDRPSSGGGLCGTARRSLRLDRRSRQGLPRPRSARLGLEPGGCPSGGIGRGHDRRAVRQGLRRAHGGRELAAPGWRCRPRPLPFGHVAEHVHQGGRTMNTQMLKDAFTQMVGQAQGLQAQYRPQIEQQARTVDVARIVQMVRAS
ncbi:MAG: hypothetical protein U5L03_05160 [Burkholderiaceae bacterium]|nr:hypothetical protein [Burkholderiaceae bacterium]